MEGESESESEIVKCAKVWMIVYMSLCYCYMLGKISQKGITRLLCLLPVLCVFLALPLYLNSIHFVGITSFFVSWLANFKLLLFAFGRGPLSAHPSLSLPRFVAFACLPIKTNQKLVSEKGPNSILNYAVKGVLLGLLLGVYGYRDQIDPRIILLLSAFHVYFSLELTLAMAGVLTRTLLGIDLESQFDEPYFSTSLQDFWGRRWNLVVATILRATVYAPVRDLSSHAVGRRWAPFPAVMATFVASAMMHEVVFYHLGRVRPTWEITGFFLLHGVCLVVEIVLKKLAAGRFRLPTVVSGTLAFGFVMVTGLWLFFPPFLRCQPDVRALEDYAAVGAFVKGVAISLVDSIGGLTVISSV